ncbi:CBS domain-containing protein [Amycolatopsis acidicola]|uniref:CBS domain-containing protein n=2 Tax=Amycolatopsis acidicola TaxID=2596893 RepID=A0A5N0V399_9PSEU|nr:CBS domain-containing protein [Amycolatopsis acidicola]
MSSPAVTTTPDTEVAVAEKILVQRGFTALPVIDEDRLAGVVTEADLLADRFPEQPHRSHATVGEVMNPVARTVDIDTDATRIARLMLDTRVRCLPVMDRGKVAGVVTRRDFLRALARPDAKLAEDVTRRLSVFPPADRWIVDVADGEATIIDRYASEKDHEVAVVLAESVPGVIRARCYVGEVEHERKRS